MLAQLLEGTERNLCINEGKLIWHRLKNTEKKCDNRHLSSICQKHREQFGVNYYPSSIKNKKCDHPNHEGKNSKLQHLQRITYNLAKQCQDSKLIIGQNICSKCRKSLNENSSKKPRINQINPFDTTTEDKKYTEEDKMDTEESVANMGETENTQHDQTNNLLNESRNNRHIHTSSTKQIASDRITRINKVLTELQELSGIEKVAFAYCFHGKLSEASQTTRSHFLKVASNVIDQLCAIFSTENENFKNYLLQTLGQKQAMFDHIKTLYTNTTNDFIKKQLLSSIATSFPNKKLLMIEGVTRYKIRVAKSFRRKLENKFDIKPSCKPLTRRRISTIQIEDFLSYITDPSLYQNLSWGSKTIKINKTNVIIPNIVRKMLNKQLITMYKQSCRGRNITPLGDTTLYKILKLCPASTQKSLTSLNDAATSGKKAIDNLILMLQSYKHRIQENHLTLLLKGANHCSDIMRAVFSTRLNESDACADHCLAHALSDPMDKNYQQKCSHAHSLTCHDCKLLKNLFKAATFIINETSHGQEKQENLHELNSIKEDIYIWKANLIQGKNQNRV